MFPPCYEEIHMADEYPLREHWLLALRESRA